jgi:hypothetical protein
VRRLQDAVMGEEIAARVAAAAEAVFANLL